MGGAWTETYWRKSWDLCFYIFQKLLILNLLPVQLDFKNTAWDCSLVVTSGGASGAHIFQFSMAFMGGSHLSFMFWILLTKCWQLWLVNWKKGQEELIFSVLYGFYGGSHLSCSKSYLKVMTVMTRELKKGWEPSW